MERSPDEKEECCGLGSQPERVADREGAAEVGNHDRHRVDRRLAVHRAAHRAGLAGAESANQWRRAQASGDRLALDVSRSLLGGATSLFANFPL